jgi:hypothetical protein
LCLPAAPGASLAPPLCCGGGRVRRRSGFAVGSSLPWRSVSVTTPRFNLFATACPRLFFDRGLCQTWCRHNVQFGLHFDIHAARPEG